ncbi:MAG: PQQ-dependent sugar dehydrogenase, partial [Nitrososphaerales archaeon]
NGGPLEFGYDGKLYITTGNGQDFAVSSVMRAQALRAQDINSPAGKILRINSDGTIPEDNPTPGLPYYTLGHRNSFGIGFHPVTKMPYITENGPACCDEVNLLTPGENYGNPYVTGKDNYDKDIPEELVGKKFVEPLMEFTPNIAPTELIFYTGDRYPGEVNNMFFLSYSNRELYRVVLEPPNYDEVISTGLYPIKFGAKDALYKADVPGGFIFNSLLDIEQGPDGYLYVSSLDSIVRLDFVYTDIPTTISVDVEIVNLKQLDLLKLKAKISDYFGNPVADVPVNFFDSDKLIGSAISNQEGIAQLEHTVEAADQHTITAKFTGGEKYKESSSPEQVLHLRS